MGSTCSMHGLMSTEQQLLVEILQQRLPCEKPKHRWESSIKVDLG